MWLNAIYPPDSGGKIADDRSGPAPQPVSEIYLCKMNPDTYMQKDSEMRGMLSVHCLFA